MDIDIFSSGSVVGILCPALLDVAYNPTLCVEILLRNAVLTIQPAQCSGLHFIFVRIKVVRNILKNKTENQKKKNNQSSKAQQPYHEPHMMLQVHLQNILLVVCFRCCISQSLVHNQSSFAIVAVSCPLQLHWKIL